MDNPVKTMVKLPLAPIPLRDMVFLNQERVLIVNQTVSSISNLLPLLQSYRSLLQRTLGLAIKESDLSPQQFNIEKNHNRAFLQAQAKLHEQTSNTTGSVRSKFQGTDSQVIDKAREIFRDAALLKASDIHIRVYRNSHTTILFRLDGSMEPIKDMTWGEGQSLCATIYQSLADVADPTYQPENYQDARIAKAEILPQGVNSIRVASGPHSNGTFMALRVLYEGNKADQLGTMGTSLKGLGYLDVHTKLLDFARRRPSGINIIAGPTGSGKSTTLKNILEAIVRERPDLNILTVEDPPEYPIAGVTQIPVTNADSSVKRSDAFTAAIRFAMRADPDIIMIGEVRDAESADLAIRAAMTGHQVWTTLHANNSFNIINRLNDMMSSPDRPDPINLLADDSIITSLTFQRLAKKLCPHCREKLETSSVELEKNLVTRLRSVMRRDADLTQIYLTGEGCDKCRKGVFGRTVIAEVVIPDADLMEVLKKSGVSAARKLWSEEEKSLSIYSHAVIKIINGEIDPRVAEETIGPITSKITPARRQRQGDAAE